MKELTKLLDKALDFNKASGVMFFIDKKNSFITDGHILLYGSMANYIIKYNEKTFKIPSALFDNIEKSKKIKDKQFKIDGSELVKDAYLPEIQDIRDKKIENSIQFTGLYYHNKDYRSREVISKVFINKGTEQVGYVQEKYYNLINYLLIGDRDIKINGQMIKVWDTSKDKSFELYVMGVKPDTIDIQADYDLLSIALGSRETEQNSPEDPGIESEIVEQEIKEDEQPLEKETITIETDNPEGKVDGGDNDFIEDGGSQAVAEQVAVESIREIINEVMQV